MSRITVNQMEKNLENEMEAGIMYAGGFTGMVGQRPSFSAARIPSRPHAECKASDCLHPTQVLAT